MQTIRAVERSNFQTPRLMQTPDDALVRAAQHGDTRAFDALVQRHDRTVVHVVLGIVGSEQDALDVAQEAFIRAYRKLHTFRFESAFATWVTRIAINQALSVRKRRRWRHRFRLEQWQESQTDDTSRFLWTAPTPDRGVLSDEFRQAYAEAMTILSDRERAVFTLKHTHEYKLREIAELLGCAEGTVKNYLFRATRKLRDALADYRDHARVH
ncbi:MAG: RNA polymerase sigma factor RpoE [Rhodothermales bacterium]